MPNESLHQKRGRVEKIIRALELAYPAAHCELNFRNPLELLISTILSAQCTDKQVNLVTADLFKKYRAAEDYARVDLTELEQDIKRIGLFRNKARNLRACCSQLVELHGGQVPRRMDELIQLNGVGRKTANVVLGNAFGINQGVVVDTHVTRLCRRLCLSREKTPEKIERTLQKLVPQEQWTAFSHLLIWHGRRRCFARTPDCRNCEISSLCPSAGNVFV